MRAEEACFWCFLLSLQLPLIISYISSMKRILHAVISNLIILLLDHISCHFFKSSILAFPFAFIFLELVLLVLVYILIRVLIYDLMQIFFRIYDKELNFSSHFNSHIPSPFYSLATFWTLASEDYLAYSSFNVESNFQV